MTFYHLQKAVLFFSAVANHCQPPWEFSSLSFLVLTTWVSQSICSATPDRKGDNEMDLPLSIGLCSVDISLSPGS